MKLIAFVTPDNMFDLLKGKVHLHQYQDICERGVPDPKYAARGVYCLHEIHLGISHWSIFLEDNSAWAIDHKLRGIGTKLVPASYQEFKPWELSTALVFFCNSTEFVEAMTRAAEKRGYHLTHESIKYGPGVPLTPFSEPEEYRSEKGYRFVTEEPLKDGDLILELGKIGGTLAFIF